jgi:hypothetical protein
MFWALAVCLRFNCSQAACKVGQPRVTIYMMIYAILPPESAPQISTPRQPWPTPGPRLSDHEHRLLAVVRRSEHQTATIWEAINGVVGDLAPHSRTEARHFRVTLLCALHRLIRLGRLRRDGRDSVALVDMPEPVPPPRAQPQPAPVPRGRVFEC